MKKNFLEEFRRLIEGYKERGFEWGKPIDYLEFRNGCSKEEMEREVLNVILNLLKNKKNKEKPDINCILYTFQKQEESIL